MASRDSYIAKKEVETEEVIYSLTSHGIYQ